LAQCVEKALALPERRHPAPLRRRQHPQLNVLAQFLTTALGGVCRRAQIAPAIVGTSEDVRELIAYRLQISPSADDGPPALTRGWRAEVVGHVLDDLLAGKLSMRIADPLADQPLAFEPAAPRKEPSDSRVASGD
jgi:ribonuclease D